MSLPPDADEDVNCATPKVMFAFGVARDRPGMKLTETVCLWEQPYLTACTTAPETCVPNAATTLRCQATLASAVSAIAELATQTRRDVTFAQPDGDTPQPQRKTADCLA